MRGYVRRWGGLAFVICGLVVLLRTSAAGTTFVVMDEPTLVRSSSVVLIGTITALESGVTASDNAIYTYVHVQPERIIKGAVGLDPLVLREPGGVVGDERQVIFGSPEFWVGERTLLFLSRNADGTLQTNSLAMGKFTLGVDASGHATAVRDLGLGASLLIPETGAIVDAPRETHRFLPMLKRVQRLARAERPVRRQDEPIVAVPTELTDTSTRFQDAFTFLSNPPARWFQPDSGEAVGFYMDYTGDRTLGFTSSLAAIDSSFAAWSTVPSSSLVLQDLGTTAPAAFSPCDMNRITFNDPYNEITDPSGCSGILAVGGYCNGGATTVVNGTTFKQIVVGKLTFNNGWGSCWFWNQCNMAEVATHEIGHTIGFGHSSDSSATMAAYAHFDGRCASLRADDIAALGAAYPRSGTPAPSPTPTSIPTATRTPTALPTATPTPGTNPVPTQAPVPTAGRSNDTCDQATVITSSPYTATLNTSAATTAATDPYPSCSYWARNKTVWFQYTAPGNGTIVANTIGSAYDTVLSVYTGSCGAFSSVAGACNDNTSYWTAQSAVSFAAVAGRTYFFMISASYFGTGGAATFHLAFNGATQPTAPTPTRAPTNTPTRNAMPSPTPTTRVVVPTATATTPPAPTPPSVSGTTNDSCASAVVIPTSANASFAGSLNTITATTATTDPYPTCNYLARTKTVWYQYTAPRSGTIVADTFGSTYDTVLSVYRGSCSSLSPVAGACNDNASYFTTQSKVSFAAVAGQTYYFMVSATYFGTGGTATFHLSLL